MNEHQSKEWTMGGCHPVRYVACDGDIWLSQRAMVEIFGLSLKTINEHLVGLVESMGNGRCRAFRVNQKEGFREISRSVKHYPFSFAYAVGVKSQRFDRLEALKTLADKEGVDTNNLIIPSNKEYVFGKMLIGALEGIAEVLPQHFVDPFSVDFYIPLFNLAVEHDDEYHFSDEQRAKDAKRQKAIEDATGMKFIRVAAGNEVRGLNDVLKTIFGARSRQLDERAAFDAWVSQYDTESNEYQDMGADEYFIAGYRAALAAQAKDQDAETLRARKESEINAAAEDYFKERTWIMDTANNRRIFESGFDRGYAARAAAKGEE